MTWADDFAEAHPPVPQVFLTLTALHSNSGGPGGNPYGGYSQYGGYSPGYEQQTHRGGIIAAQMQLKTQMDSA